MTLGSLDVQPDAVPIGQSDSEGPGTYILSTLAQGFVQVGFLQEPSDLADVALGFTVETEEGDAVPYANLIVDFGDLGRMRITRTDASGQAALSFSEELLLRDPFVFGEKDGRRYGVHFRMTATGVSDSEPLVTINLSTLERREVGQADLLYFDSGVPPDQVTFYESLLRRQRAFLTSDMGLQPIAWGMALVDTTGSVSISPSQVRRGEQMATVWPFSIRDDAPPEIARVNLHEWTEATLRTTFEGLPRWIADGLAEHAPIAFYRTLSPQEEVELEVHEHYGPRLADIQERVTTLAGDRETFDLLAWPYAGVDYALGDPTQPLGYAAAAAFWFEVVETTESDIVARFLDALPHAEPVSNEVALNALETVTGRDYVERLRSFPLADVRAYYGQLAAELSGGN